MQALLEGVEDFGTDADGIGNAGGAHRHDHEFLEVDGVVGMFAAIDDVHHRHRQDMGRDAADIAIERQTARIAAALATASETPRMALAPRLPLFSEPSSAIIAASMSP